MGEWCRSEMMYEPMSKESAGAETEVGWARRRVVYETPVNQFILIKGILFSLQGAL